MAAPFLVQLITPEREIFNGPSEQLSVPGVAGSLGILANHAPLLTALKIGEAVLTEPGGQRRHFYIGGGFLEVNKNHVTILAEDAAGEDELSPAEAERLHQAARERLSAAEGTDAVPDAELQLDRAEARLKVIRRDR